MNTQAQSQKAKQTTLLYGFPKNTEITEKKVDVQEALSRVRPPLDAVTVTLEVYGVYALPESWKAKVVSYIFIHFSYLHFLG